MATTTNYGWTTPDDTALVKDGAAAIRTLGSSVDTTTKNLNPSTTLGDIEYRSSTANTNTRLGIGTTGQVLTVAGGVPSWATATSGGMTLISTTTFNNTVNSYTLSSIPQTYKHLFVVGSGLQSAHSSDDNLFWRFNGDTASNYSYRGLMNSNSSITAFGQSGSDQIFYQSNVVLARTGDTLSTRFGMFVLNIYDYTSASYKAIDWNGGSTPGDNPYYGLGRGAWNNTAAITSLYFEGTAGVGLKAGIVRLYGVS